ncbi:tRNA pseudouridine synthase B [Sphaerotilus hippei]|uniref:tRNA pseudouridine synthase B n=1 Tax=Sphaerotilus hippei TaxID=744406 RepID=A0A318H3U8_9BURK|nr:tRNA pseudouridine(55) synthase TruB [Sphaerotilus hippei]PXW98134.1 tRNA pseudouridine synthase B [Sphaerotilus hippei]
MSLVELSGAPVVTDTEPTAQDTPRSARRGEARAPRVRIVRRALHGVLLLDKPIGLSSNDALQKAKWLLRAEKAGHTGTLDPLATGLLPLCFGAATKFSQVSLEADKGYRATLRLGQRTASADAETPVTEERPVTCTRADIERVCAAYTGPIDQMPPMHSALKHQGKALYEYARAGQTIERVARRVTLHTIDIVSWQDERLVIDVHCSKGTYIRTLADDIGQALGCGAHLSALRRICSGPLTLAGSTTLAALEAMSEEQRAALLLPVDVLLADWPTVSLRADEAARFLSGMRRLVSLPDAAHVRVYGPDERTFLGSAHIEAGELIADRLLSPPEVQAMAPA